MVNNDLKIIEIEAFQQEEFRNEAGIRVWVHNDSIYPEIVQNINQKIKNVIFSSAEQKLLAGEKKSIKIFIKDQNLLTDFQEVSSGAPENSGIRALKEVAQTEPNSKLIFETEHGNFIIELKCFNETIETVLQ